MRQNSQIHFAIAFIYGTSISILNCTTSNVPAIYNFNYVILNYKLMNYFPIDKFSEFCQLGMIDIIHQLVVTNRRFLRIDELCLTEHSHHLTAYQLSFDVKWPFLRHISVK